MAQANEMASERSLRTKILAVDARRVGRVIAVPRANDYLDDFDIELDADSADAQRLRFAADQLRKSDIPVAFPTETVYGLGANAKRSAAVHGIYHAKRRPADNPLIVHFASLTQLRRSLGPSENGVNGDASGYDPIPEIYRPLISRFWPGPLTIILPNPPHSGLAPEVTAGLNTFGARIPRHTLALALIKLSGVPVAAPSANASTKPSPTAAEHVAFDLDGRIETIVDGGPCDVGVESTVVDGLSNPPLVLRPGGVGIDQIRACPGWENTRIGYKNVSETDNHPKAPGMKYRHYSPKAPVVLYGTAENLPTLAHLTQRLGSNGKLGIVTTKFWTINANGNGPIVGRHDYDSVAAAENIPVSEKPGFAGLLDQGEPSNFAKSSIQSHQVRDGKQSI